MDILKHNKGSLAQSHSQHQHKWRQVQCYSIKIRKKPMLPTPFVATSISQLKEINGIEIPNEHAKVSLFADDVKVYISNPKNSTGNLYS